MHEPAQNQDRNQPLPLSALLESVQFVLKDTFYEGVWITAEIANVNESQRGHMYFELVEKEGGGIGNGRERIVAKSRANLWANRKGWISRKFEDVTRETLKAGMKIMALVTVEFHPVYSFSVQIHDIEPSYSLGEMERQKQETIERLKREGLYDRNRQFTLPEVIQDIAIISSPTAAGYQDFIEQLTTNQDSYTYNTLLFPATVQGEQAPKEIARALNAVNNYPGSFDAVVLIRGGGSSIDLSCFDDYEVASFIATSRLPVITGIGHERDESVADMVANLRLKTPTAVANFILDQSAAFDKELQQHADRLSKLADRAINSEKELFTQMTRQFYYRVRSYIDTQQQELHFSGRTLHAHAKRLLRGHERDLDELRRVFIKQSQRFLKEQERQLGNMEQYIRYSDPQRLLQKGFSITSKNGAIITSPDQVEEGETVQTRVQEGTIDSKIIEKAKEKKKNQQQQSSKSS